MVKFALAYREPLNDLTGSRGMKLRAYELTEEEWKIAEQLAGVLEVFKEATLFFSGSTPNLSKVIPAMDYIDKHLASGSLNTKYLPSIQASMLIGKRLLNKYYNMTDHSEVYRIAMGWEEEWIDTAREIVQAEFDRGYADICVEDSEDEEVIMVTTYLGKYTTFSMLHMKLMLMKVLKLLQ
ncbi:hypothetical protein BYT27DRAFT_7221544 [Phlegmacium glaucopus]|nr:hypothetical protein BYT27DRAFT_7221544 [Phlegmacium glaucopus]